MVRLVTLGRVRVVSGDEEIPLRPAEITLLAYIGLQAAPASRESLASLLWPGKSLSRARRSLSQLFYKITHSGAASSLRIEGELISAGDLITDLHELNRRCENGQYKKAAELYTGGFLQFLPLSPGLSEWRDRKDTEVAELVSSCLLHLLESGQPSDNALALEIARRLCERHSYSERATAAYVRGLIRQGRTEEASRIHQNYTREYEENLLPLIDDLIAQEQAYCKVELAVPSEPACRFVGRGREQAFIMSAWETMLRTQEGQVVLVEGEPGIGKTRLAVQVLRKIALSGGKVWSARCQATNQRMPYVVVGDLFRENYDDAPESSIGEWEIQFIKNGTWPNTQERIGVEEWNHRLLQRLTAVIEDTAQIHPLVIFIDDVQWVDDFTGLLIKYWTYRLRSSRVLLLFTARTEDVINHDWTSAELSGANVLELRQLSPEEADSLAKAYEEAHKLALHSHRRNDILWQTAGRPFFLLETLATVAQDPEQTDDFGSTLLPESVETTIRRRFRRLPEDAGWLIGILAVWARPIDLARLSDISRLQERELAVALDVLDRRGILTWGDGQLSFPHDLMRETAYRTLAPATRALLHREIAVLLEAEGREAGVLAIHYSEAGASEKAAMFALAAARNAEEHRLFSDAAFYYRLTIEHGTEAQRTVAVRGLSWHYCQAGRSADAQKLLDVIPAELDDEHLKLLRAAVSLERALAEGTTTAAEMVKLSEAVMTTVETVDATKLAPLVGILLDVALDSCKSDFGAALLETFFAEEKSRGPSEFRTQLAGTVAVWEALTVGTDVGAGRLSTALARLTPHSHDITHAICLHAQGTICLLRGELHDAISILPRAAKHAEEAGDVRRQTALSLNLGVALLENGRTTEARQYFEKAASTPLASSRIRAYANLSALHLEEGDWTSASQAADAVLATNAAYQSPLFHDVAHAIKGLSALEQGKFQLALSHRQQLTEDVDPTVTNDTSFTVALIARLQCEHDDHAKAMSILHAAIEYARPRNMIAALRLECELARALCAYDRDAAHRTAKLVEEFCARSGIALVQRRAAAVLQLCKA